MIRIDTVFTGYPGLPGYNSLYFEGDTQLLAEEAHDQVAAFWTTLIPVWSDGLSIEVLPEAAIINQASGEVTSFVGVSGAQMEGGSTNGPVSAPTQFVVTLRTNTVVAGRRLRGRIFIPGFNYFVNQPDGTPSDTTREYVRNNADVYLLQGTADLLVWHRPVNDAGGSTGVVSDVATSPVWGVLRSRRD